MKGALFDLDGVLVDSEGLYSRFWGRIGRDFGVPYPDFSHRIKGNTLEKILDDYFPNDADRKEIVRQLVEYEENMDFQLFPGAKDYLLALRASGVKCALVTSSNRNKLGYLFARIPELENLMDVIIDGDMVSRSKPDPEGYLLAAQRIGCQPEDCCVFEDSLAGMEAGRRSGATVIALATTLPIETIQHHGNAHHIISSFTELLPHRQPDTQIVGQNPAATALTPLDRDVLTGT